MQSLKTTCSNFDDRILNVFRKKHYDSDDDELRSYIEMVKPERPDKYEKRAYEILQQQKPDMDERTIRVYAESSMPRDMFDEFSRKNFFRKGWKIGTPPSDYFKANIDDCDINIRQWVTSIEHGSTNGLLITGKTRAGKTFASLSAIKELAKHHTVGFITDKQLLREIKSTFERHSKTEQEVIDSFVSPYVLVIDDLGKAQATEWSTSYLFEIINTRIERNRPTTITTQFDKNAIFEKIAHGSDEENAAAIISRVYCEFENIHLDGEYLRRTA